jgi:hypothetical protein
MQGKYRELARTFHFKTSTIQIIPTISQFDAVDVVKQNMKQVKIVSMYREIFFRFGYKETSQKIVITIANSGFKQLLEQSKLKPLDGKDQCYTNTFITDNCHRRPIL